MKNYDDLQRFKDKTRTGDINFKDLSAQKKGSAASEWAIINQLSGGSSDSALAKAGSVAVPIPQPVKPGEFDAASVQLAKAPVAPAPVMQPAGSPQSILQSMSAEPPVKREPQQQPPVASSLFEQLQPETPAVAPQPVIQSIPAPAPVVAPAPVPAPAATLAAPKQSEPVRFDQLFATKSSSRASHPIKDLPLQPLLEKIASCR